MASLQLVPGLRAVLVILLAADIILALVLIHDSWFFEQPESSFLLSALDFITLRVGQVVLILSIALGIFAGTILSNEQLAQLFVVEVSELIR
jgi:hypothetical protein